jgi:hypothetical protein
MPGLEIHIGGAAKPVQVWVSEDYLSRLKEALADGESSLHRFAKLVFLEQTIEMNEFQDLILELRKRAQADGPWFNPFASQPSTN